MRASLLAGALSWCAIRSLEVARHGQDGHVTHVTDTSITQCALHHTGFIPARTSKVFDKCPKMSLSEGGEWDIYQLIARPIGADNSSGLGR
jgi:hypothetical protein